MKLFYYYLSFSNLWWFKNYFENQTWSGQTHKFNLKRTFWNGKIIEECFLELKVKECHMNRFRMAFLKREMCLPLGWQVRNLNFSYSCVFKRKSKIKWTFLFQRGLSIKYFWHFFVNPYYINEWKIVVALNVELQVVYYA